MANRKDAQKKTPTRAQSQKKPATRVEHDEYEKKNKPSSAARKEAVAEDKPKNKIKKEHMIIKSMVPYLLIVLALILAICFFTVHILGLEEGVGVVGYRIQWILCGMFGVAAFLIPFALGFIGVKWCLYNIKKKDAPKNDDAALELQKLRKRNVLQTVMASLTVFFISVLLGVLFDAFDSVDIVNMWDEAAVDLVGGGVIGGVPAVLMVTAFESVISVIIIAVCIAVSVILVLGITPDRVVIYINNRIALRRERREEELLEQRRLEAKREADEKKTVANKNNRPEYENEDVFEVSDIPAKKKDIVDEIIDEFEAEEDAVYIGPSRDDSALTGKIEFKEEAEIPQSEVEEAGAPKGEDFGGDPVFDNPDFNGMSGLMNELKNKKEVAIPPVNDSEPEEIDLSLIGTEELLSDIAAVAPDDEDEEPVEVEMPYVFPPVDMLALNKNPSNTDFSAELQDNARKLMETLKSFKVSIKEITYSRGPTITRYELKPEVGTRVRSIANLVDDIALSLATTGVRIEAPIPNKPAVGIEVPNRERATVYLRDLIENSKFTDSKSRLTSCLGMDVGGNPVYFDIGKMPHLLIAGTTGSGKSVCINTIILSILYKSKPNEVKLILIDPKQVEFTVYENIPHLYCPIVSEPKKAAGALASAVSEMERRFELIKSVGVRNIEAYNEITANDPDMEYLPKMVIIIDELADLMMTARDEVETSICRLAQKARAAGIHVILGTQRPSVDVITGLIKANVPSRIACTVTSQVDSRTIIDVSGAENLIGYGDMLFAPVGASKPMRVQGAFVSDGEVENIVNFIKENNGNAKYNGEFIKSMEENAKNCGNKKGSSGSDTSSFEGASDGEDSKFSDAVKLAIEEGKISTSLMQRRLGVGYGRAAKIIDTMEQMGYVSKPDGNKPRRVLITMDEYMRRMVNDDLGGEE